MAPSSDETRTLRAARLVAAALILGQILFAVVAAAARQSVAAVRDAGGLEAVGIAAIALGLAALAAAIVLRMTLKVPADSDPRTRAAALFKRAIMPLALLEGGGLFNLVAWLVLPEAVGNLLLAGLLVAIQVALFPRAPAPATGMPPGEP